MKELDTDDPKKSWSVLQKLFKVTKEVAEKLNSLFVDKVENIVQEHSPDPVQVQDVHREVHAEEVRGDNELQADFEEDHLSVEEHWGCWN